MTDTRQVTEASQALKLMMAGNARVTIVSPKTGDRYTYRVRQSKDGQVHFEEARVGEGRVFAVDAGRSAAQDDAGGPE